MQSTGIDNDDAIYRGTTLVVAFRESRSRIGAEDRDPM